MGDDIRKSGTSGKNGLIARLTLGLSLLVIFGGGLLAWGTIRGNVSTHETRFEKVDIRIEKVEKLQDIDHDAIIRVETKVDQIEAGQTEMRHDLKHIIRKLENEG